MAISLTRRQLGAMALAGGAASLLPRRARAASAVDRRFIFFFLKGGWDYSYLVPLHDNANVDSPTDSEPAEAGGCAYTSGPTRPAIDEFFENYGDRTCIINGIEVPSVAHDRCIRLSLTGGTAIDADDFPTIIASKSAENLLMPHTVVSGPGFAGSLGSYVVRVGENGQLGDLMSGVALDDSDMPVTLDTDIEAAVDSFVRKRAAGYAASGVGGKALSGRAQTYADRYAGMLEKLASVGSELSDVNLSASSPDEYAAVCVAILERGLARTAMMQHLGLYDAAWDTHASNITQDSHFELAFQTLNKLMQGLDAATSPLSGQSLATDTTVVVFSEMGRSPKLNGQQGKDHWTYTTAMLIGSGIRGGQTVGAFTDDVAGATIDFDSGELTDSGRAPHVKDIGATLLALADVDPGDYLSDALPIGAVMRED